MADDDDLRSFLEAGNGWREYKNQILYRLNQVDSTLTTLDLKLQKFQSDEIGKLKVEIAMLKVRVSLWAGAVGFAAAAVVELGVRWLVH